MERPPDANISEINKESIMIKSYPKNKPFRSKKAIEWFRTQPCDCCGASGDGIVTGHHEPLGGHGIASKGADDEQIPLCYQCHRERHDAGRKTFYGVISWRFLVMKYQDKVNKYLNGRKQ